MKFPTNLETMREKILIYLHMEGLIKRRDMDLPCKHNNRTMQQQVSLMLSDGLVVSTKNHIRLTEKGLAEYSKLLKILEKRNEAYTVSFIEILDMFKSAIKPIGVQDILSKYYNKSPPKFVISRIRNIITKLLQENEIAMYGVYKYKKTYIHKNSPLLLNDPDSNKRIKKLQNQDNLNSNLGRFYALTIPRAKPYL